MPRKDEPAEPQCLTDELLAEMIDGRLEVEDAARLHRHAAGCPACFSLLVAVMRGGVRVDAARALPLVASESLLRLEPAPAPPPVRWTPPSEFEEFRLERLLGRGAMGVVYLAHDRSLDRHVAVKFIATREHSARVRARFQTEARAIARLQHPNVVTVFRVGEAEGHPYLVSEYLVGQSLAELALPLPWRRVLRLGLGLARGLAAAHRQGVLHRDIKPSNAFLTAEGEVKLLDFGLAEMAGAGNPAEAGGERALVGTPRYMAPELFRGESATPQSDLYALGIALYELCAGTLLRRRDLSLPEGTQHLPGRVGPSVPGGLPPLTERVPGIDLDFASLIERCLRAVPGERFASADALCAEFERLGRSYELEIASTDNPYRGLAPFEAEHRALFFGRDKDIKTVLERLRSQRMVLVAGDSGVGKSSLCRAGILPRAAQGALDEYRGFSTLALEPGRRPLAALVAALAPILGETEAQLRAMLAEAPAELGGLLRAAYQEGRGLLLFVDQLEELFTLSEPEQVASFASILGELTLPSVGVRVLLAVRGDFLTRVGTLPGLGGELERVLYLLRPLAPEGVREAIVGPARARGVVFESEALLQTLVEATAQRAGSLPLLQFALAELWERREPARGCITRVALDTMGGVAGALSRHADGVLARLSPVERLAARRLLGSMVTAEGTCGERSEDELMVGSEEARAALRALVSGRLLHARTAGGQTRYGIAHEALITNWAVLRDWLDEDADQRVLRQRMEAAGAEWERLGRLEELLWRRPQLDEVRMIDEATLGARERAFLRGSQHAVRRQRRRRWLAAALLVLGVSGLPGGWWLSEYLETREIVRARMTAAQDGIARMRELSQQASASREKALSLFNDQDSSGPTEWPDPRKRWQQAEEVWDRALDELRRAETASTEAEQALEEVLARAHEHEDALQLLIQLTYERLVLAERFHQEKERSYLAHQLERLTAHHQEWRARLGAPAALELETTPPGATVELTRYVDDNGVLQRKQVPIHRPLGPTPITRMTLPAGSYHLRLMLAGHAPVDLPLLLDRGQHEQVHLVLPTAVPDGYIYIPPGCFLMGSADLEEIREQQESMPLHRRCLEEGYLIGQTEVILGDWMTYLEDLPAGAPARHILETPRIDSSGSALTLSQQPDGSWRFSLYLVGGERMTVRRGEALSYPGRNNHRGQDWSRFPLAGVSADDVRGYLAWLDRSGRLPGARLCTELEWTRAARGADGRRFPHGHRLQDDEANIDATYGRRDDAYGPDEIGAHQASVSPFGLLDMAGNAFEMTQPVTRELGEIVLKGGAWYYSALDALIAVRQASTSALRDARVGVRVCAPVR